VNDSIETPSGAILEFFNHTYLTVGDQFGNVFVLEGLPQNPTFPFGNLVSHVFVFNGVTVAGDPQDHPLGPDQIQGVIGPNNPHTCDLVNRLIYDTNHFDGLSGGPHSYLGIISNSNSFLSFILYIEGIIDDFGQPPQTPGWGGFNPPRPLP